MQFPLELEKPFLVERHQNQGVSKSDIAGFKKSPNHAAGAKLL